MPPRILDDVHEIAVVLGHRAVLPCTVKASSGVKITWFKEKFGSIVFSERITLQKDGSLVFLGSDKSDAGIYKCVVTNQFGKVSKVVRLTVKSKFLFRMFLILLIRIR